MSRQLGTDVAAAMEAKVGSMRKQTAPMHVGRREWVNLSNSLIGSLTARARAQATSSYV